MILNHCFWQDHNKTYHTDARHPSYRFAFISLQRLWLSQQGLSYYPTVQPGFPCCSPLHSQVQLPALAVKVEDGCLCTNPAHSPVIRQNTVILPLRERFLASKLIKEKVTSPNSVTRSDTDKQDIVSICILCEWKNKISSYWIPERSESSDMICTYCCCRQTWAYKNKQIRLDQRIIH